MLGLLSTVALALSVAGGIVVGNAKTMVDVNRGTSLRHVGVILFVVLFVLIFFVHVFYWSNKESIMKYRQKVRANGLIAPHREDSPWATPSHFSFGSLRIAPIRHFDCSSIPWPPCGIHPALGVRTGRCTRNTTRNRRP